MNTLCSSKEGMRFNPELNLTLQIHFKKGRHGGDGHCLESDYSLYLLKVETAYKSRDKGNLIYRLVSSNERLLKKEPDFFLRNKKCKKATLTDIGEVSLFKNIVN